MKLFLRAMHLETVTVCSAPCWNLLCATYHETVAVCNASLNCYCFNKAHCLVETVTLCNIPWNCCSVQCIFKLLLCAMRLVETVTLCNIPWNCCCVQCIFKLLLCAVRLVETVTLCKIPWNCCCVQCTLKLLLSRWRCTSPGPTTWRSTSPSWSGQFPIDAHSPTASPSPASTAKRRHSLLTWTSCLCLRPTVKPSHRPHLLRVSLAASVVWALHAVCILYSSVFCVGRLGCCTQGEKKQADCIVTYRCVCFFCLLLQ